jgi:hypothetical protein
MTTKGIPKQTEFKKISASSLIRDLLSSRQREALLALARIGLEHADAGVSADDDVVEIARTIEQNWKGANGG